MVRSVLILGFAGVQALDLVGPSEVFTSSTLCLQGMGRADDGYDVRVVSRNGEPATTGTGLALVAEPLPDPRGRVDTIVLPGGFGAHTARQSPDVIGWIQIAAENARRALRMARDIAHTSAREPWRGGNRLSSRAGPHRGGPSPARGDRRHGHRDRRPLRVRHRRDSAP
jgi:transcriptional regulator GlxA family with amidase domain